jgi:inner membrane protein
MSAFVNFLGELGPWSWFLLAALLLGLEVVLPGVHFIWFGLAAGIVGGLTLATGMSWAWQLIAFGLIACGVVYWLRDYADPSRVTSDEPDLNVRGNQYVGRIVIVEDAVAGGRGKVRIGDTLWSAKGVDLAAGSSAKVIGVDGIVLIVEAA